MSEYSSWMQSNWHALGNLLIQLAFLAAGVWFARNLLRAMKSFQDQLGALLRSSASAKHPLADESPYWLTPSDAQPSSLPEPTESGPGRFAVAWRRFVFWLKAPMSTPGMATWHRVIRWLQAPIGS